VPGSARTDPSPRGTRKLRSFAPNHRRSRADCPAALSCGHRRRLFLRNSRTGTDSAKRLAPQVTIASNHTGNRRHGRLPRLSVQLYPPASNTRDTAHQSPIPATRRSHLGMFGIAEVVDVSHRSNAGSVVSPIRAIPPDSSIPTPASEANGECPVKNPTSEYKKIAAQNNHAHMITQEIFPSSLLCLLRAIGIMVATGILRDPG
jgi:hypothetical protein